MKRSLKAALMSAVVAIVAATTLLVVASPAAAASLTQVTGFGNNPTNLNMYIYVPNNVSSRPALLVAMHYCGGSASAVYSGYAADYVHAADQYGYIIVFPEATRSGNCFDVYTQQALTRGGGSDPVGIISMVDYAKQHYNVDPARVYVTGFSSGAMMTNVMAAEYPDVFAAGAAFMGVPATCFATTGGSTWNSDCSSGTITKTAQQWGDAARAMDPGYSGSYPRMQLWHGTVDDTLNYHNLGEEIKQWTNLKGVSATAVRTDSPQSTWTRTRYGSDVTQAPVEAFSISGAGHVLPQSGMVAYAIAFLGLNATTPTSAPPTTTPPTTTPPATTPPPGGSCAVTVTRTDEWSDRFNVSLAVTGSNTWQVAIGLNGSQSLQNSWSATVSGTTGTLTATPNGAGNTFGITLYKNGNNTNPTATCTVPGSTTTPPPTTNPPTSNPPTSNPPTTNPPTTTTPPPGGSCSVSVTRTNEWSDRFNVTLAVTGTNSWRVTIGLNGSQSLQNSWQATVSGTSGTLTATPNGSGNSFGITLYKNGNNTNPTATCTVT